MTDPDLPSSLSVLVVEDHPLVRQGLRALLDAAVEDLRFREAETARQALVELGRERPDVAVVDLSLPEKPGLALVREMRAMTGDLPILILSMHPEDVYARRALEAGASGYVMKEAGGPVVLEALAAILRNRVYLSDEAALHVAASATGAAATPSPSADFTGREFEIWTLLGHGVQKRGIAGRLGISLRTVESHCYNIRQKTGLENASELVHAATRWVAAQGPV